MRVICAIYVVIVCNSMINCQERDRALTEVDLLRLLRHSNPSWRAFAASRLGETKKPEYSPALIEALLDLDPVVRGKVALALAELKDRKAAPKILDALARSLPSRPIYVVDELRGLGDML